MPEMQSEMQVGHHVNSLEVKYVIQIEWLDICIKLVCMKIESEFENNSWFAKPVDSVC
jgi:hypothetical protein